MKNNREVCYAIDAGYTEFSDLPGRFKTGCPNTPSYKSRFCSVHIPCALSESADNKPVQLPGIIINKRQTRVSELYQVYKHKIKEL